MTPLLASVAYLLLALGAIGVYSLVLLAVFGGRSWRNGYEACLRDQTRPRHPSNPIRAFRRGDHW